MSTPGGLTAALADRYRLERELGQGGMATVYLALDLKHDRNVAIKVLRPELAAVIGADRFLREIKTIATLQHPHILGLIDSGEMNGTAYYVMPFVEGESLRDRLTREKQLPIGDAVRIATEVAGALDYAHRHGVIHRDIKPENILLHDGRALVADFGIALAASNAGGSRMTETGMSLGTPHYMSPEQAMGEREITARSDVYALGCVSYEMLVGEPPFTGPTAQAIIAKVMTGEPARPGASRKSVPPAVDDAVLTALEKLPADRFATAAEFALALAGEGAPRRRANVASATHRPPSRRALLGAGGGALLLALAAFLGGQRLGRAEAPAPSPSRLAIIAPTLGGSGGSAQARLLTITPAGDAVAYIGGSERGSFTLYLQRLDATEPVEVAGTIGLRGPVMSLDGRSIFGTTPNTSHHVPLQGGSPKTLVVPPNIGHGAWGPDGSFWFTLPNSAGIARLTPADTLAVLPREKTGGLRIQQVLGDGRTALVVAAPAGSSTGPGLLLDLRTAELTPLVDGPVVELRSAAGELFSVLPDGSLTATPFDAERRRLRGSPVQVVRGVALTGTGIAHFAVASNGTLAYVPETPQSLVLVDRGGATQTVVGERTNVHAPHFSPDGRRLSFDITSSDGRDVWILALDQRTLTRATFDRDGHDATWAPDGRHLTYITFKAGPAGIYRTRPGSTAPAESLLATAAITYTGTWLRDGSALITTGIDLRGASGGDIARIANGGRGPVEPLLASPFLESYPAPSPDGRWLAFVSDQSGRQEVYVRPLDGEGDLVQVSQEGGAEPVWGPDGRELFYRATAAGRVDLVAAAIRTTPDLAITSRTSLFPLADFVSSAPHANYDISPDGRSFAMVQRSLGSHIVVIQALPELLRRLRSGGGESP